MIRWFHDEELPPLAALSDLFVQVLALCQKAGLVGLGYFAVDGTKLRANASKQKAMSYERMVKAEDELAAEVASWLDKATEVDATEDAEHGPDQRGDETPEWMANKQQRLDRIRAARVALKAEAKAAAAAKDAARQSWPSRRTAPRPSGAGPNPHAHLARPSPARSATSPIPRAGS